MMLGRRLANRLLTLTLGVMLLNSVAYFELPLGQLMVSSISPLTYDGKAVCSVGDEILTAKLADNVSVYKNRNGCVVFHGYKPARLDADTMLKQAYARRSKTYHQHVRRSSRTRTDRRRAAVSDRSHLHRSAQKPQPSARNTFAKRTKARRAPQTKSASHHPVVVSSTRRGVRYSARRRYSAAETKRLALQKKQAEQALRSKVWEHNRPPASETETGVRRSRIRLGKLVCHPLDPRCNTKTSGTETQALGPTAGEEN